MELTTLKAYVEEAKLRYDEHKEENPNYSIPFEDEDLVYAIQDWYSMLGEFTEEEYEYLEKTWGFTKDEIDFATEHDPATGLSIDDEEDDE